MDFLRCYVYVDDTIKLINKMIMNVAWVRIRKVTYKDIAYYVAITLAL